ncbi:MAG: DMT family transporter [Candidatus Aminicenantes bacterium]|nr:DMT family transporter [Candidatus Aminicenantes bacterium]
MESIPYIGEILSLLTAVFWAVAVILFKKSGETVHPIGLNLFKNAMGFLLLLVTLGLFKEALLLQVPLADYGLLMLSGAIGIGIGDTLLFACLNLLGAGLTAIVDCLYSPFIIVFAVLFLGERLTFLQIFGAVLVVFAVLTISLKGGGLDIDRPKFIRGIIFGILAILSTAVGVVIVKPLLSRVPFLWATEVRLLGALLMLTLILLFHHGRRKILSSILDKKSRLYVIAGSFFGAYMAMLFWLGGMKLTQASIASALNQTNSIFIVILAAVWLKEPLNARRIFAIIIAFLGVILVSFG